MTTRRAPKLLLHAQLLPSGRWIKRWFPENPPLKPEKPE